MEVLPEGVSAPLKKGPGLYEFLVEAQLQHYFNSFKNNLKVTHPSQLKFTTEGDLSELGMSKPEMRRLRKYYEKHFPNNYLSKFKKLLSVRKQESIGTDPVSLNNDNAPVGRATRVPSKHIIPAANITVNKELGMGEFGVVQQGVWCNEGERIQVAIKCLARERMQTNTIEFLKEAAIMHSIDHHHIVRFFGVVLDTGSLMLVTELAPLRSLLECLKEPSLRTSFPVLTLCDFAVQICDGMQYLESKRLIHRDLAARNILVFSKNKVKISDFGLSRALGQGKDYYKTNFNVNLKLPIAWCAPECISYLRFTTATDVWAFGVTLWEMFSYGFQPWAALTGQQILESIDEPNFQRLEQPDCCPQDHYALMLDCWRHEASSRPRFIDISTRLIDCRPEQVQTKVGGSGDGPHLLHYRIGDVITVLDKVSYRPYWKGVASSGKAGLFDPINVVAYLGSDLPSSNFLRTDATRTSARRKLRSEMISAPQGDFKHTGHVGLDGAYFGDISFLGGAKVDYGGIPTQVVAPYRPHEDLEIAPLLEGDRILPPPAPAPDHEYHEISDDENNHSPSLDLGPSLMAEMQMVFKTLGQPLQPPPSPADHETTNKTNEMRERNKPRKQVVNVKPISAQDQKTLDTAIALANEITTRSMSAPAPTTPSSPTKRKFSFRFPSVTDHHHEKIVERRNFSEEAQSTPDLQHRLRCSLTSLDEFSQNNIRLPLWDKASAEFCFAKSRELLTKPFFSHHHHHHYQKAPHNSCRDLNTSVMSSNNAYSEASAGNIALREYPRRNLESRFQQLSLDGGGDFYPSQIYRDRTLTKSESMARKTYKNDNKFNRFERNGSFLHDIRPPPPSPFNSRNGADGIFLNEYYDQAYTPIETYDNVFVYDNSFPNETPTFAETTRPRAMSYSESQEILPNKKSSGKSIRDRNRRRQSYNPQAYAQSSSSESDCTSLGSVDLDWRRRKRLSRLSASNSSIRSEMVIRSRNFLKPDLVGKILGRSPPPSNSILSGLSPTSVARLQNHNVNTSSDSSI
ncbi:PREDICTED: tyrosine-protein kinase PR2 isoform X3 [Nicrophorus vespilloides]|uniref:non-specific protein-tyrosine kinase n=1 Tax=Nicrophorus vespilloides TaxID=110193 RepID=A0ABM1MDP5_NICVS|nr:PREDICTED: tyrosine-protein kinase PR2 isoform X3 [Nicrophorus vespilloides]